MAVKPVPPSIKDELNYSRKLIALTRVTIQAPLARAVLESQSVSEVLAASAELAGVVGSIDDLGADIASTEFSGIAERHTTKFTRSMAGKIPDLGLKMSDQTISAWLSGKVERNVGLIKGLTDDQFNVFNTKINKLFTGGEFDRQAVAGAAKDAFGVGDSRAKLIGRDQVSKATGELNSIRQKEVGIDKYRWLTSGDSRVRSSHAENNGQVFEWGSPPSTGHPGEDIQCRCVAIPIIN
jgi:SPP1 gp7 family putative phage head morphogenesis protein